MEGRRSWRENWLVFKHYWPRLLVTCGGWVVNDLAFYGVRTTHHTLTLPLHLSPFRKPRCIAAKRQTL